MRETSAVIESVDFETIFKKSAQLTTSENAYLTIERAIIKNVLPGGTWLSEELLSSKLNISRTPLRDALIKLQAMELIERGINGRLYVKNVTIKEAEDIYTVRQALEDLSLVQAFNVIKDIDILQLQLDIEQMKKADLLVETQPVGERGREFHNRIILIANNHVTNSIINQLQPRFDRYRYLSTSTGKVRTSKAIDEHVQIFEAIKNNDLRTARLIMKQHLENGKNNVIEALKKIEKDGDV